MKKILFAAACVLTLTLSSCFENAGFSQTGDFARIVTINRDANPLQLEADYTGETFKLDNLTMPEQLGVFGLQDAKRALVSIHYEIDDTYKTEMKLNTNGTKPIKICSLWNKAVPDSSKIKPLTDLYKMQLDSRFSYPLIWMADGYLNIAPVIQSAGMGTYYLMPQEVIGDTLCFAMAAEYTEVKNKDVVDFINFDFATLVDTVDAAEATKPIVRAMLNAIADKDSVRVEVVSEYRTKTFMGADTIVKLPAYTGYTSQLKSLVK